MILAMIVFSLKKLYHFNDHFLFVRSFSIMSQSTYKVPREPTNLMKAFSEGEIINF